MFLRSRCALIWHQLSYKCCRNSIRHGNSKHLEVLLHDASLIEQQHLEDLCLSYLSKERFSLFVVHKKKVSWSSTLSVLLWKETWAHSSLDFDNKSCQTWERKGNSKGKLEIYKLIWSHASSFCNFYVQRTFVTVIHHSHAKRCREPRNPLPISECTYTKILPKIYNTQGFLRFKGINAE